MLLRAAQENETFKFESVTPIYREVLRAAAKTEVAVQTLRGWATGTIRLTKGEEKKARSSLKIIQQDICNQIGKLVFS